MSIAKIATTGYLPRVLTHAYLKEALDLDSNGVFWWKVRPQHHFKSAQVAKGVNAMFAGKRAGRVNSWGYVQIGLQYKMYFAHRLVWLWHHGSWPKQLDHINRNRLDNRIENLREASDSNNQANVGLRANNTSGFRGVTRRGKKWRANICVRGIKAEFVGFDTPEEASAAYEEAHRKAFGNFSAPA